MNYLQRVSELLKPSIVRGRVPINPAVTREARFREWIDSIDTSARFCDRHQRTQLVLDRGASERSTLSRVDGVIWFEWYGYSDDAARKFLGVCHFFEAVFHCPACGLQYAQVPPEFYESRFDGFDTKTTELVDNLAKCRQFAAQVNSRHCGFLMMSGFSGNGKTRLACNVVREVDGTDKFYIRQAELTSKLRATYARKDVFLHQPRLRNVEYYDDDEPTLLKVIQKVDLLVLDELGCGPLANDERLFLDELIKYRYDNRSPTILISNLPIGEAKAFLGDALTERIAHAAGNGRYILQFSGESHRRTSGESYLDGLT